MLVVEMRNQLMGIGAHGFTRKEGFECCPSEREGATHSLIIIMSESAQGTKHEFSP
jgi:hypothetical protein